MPESDCQITETSRIGSHSQRTDKKSGCNPSWTSKSKVMPLDANSVGVGQGAENILRCLTLKHFAMLNANDQDKTPIGRT